MPVIQTKKLCRSYGRRRGVVDVDLSIDEGEIFGFLGPNGAGKSTTIRLLLGFLRASSGSASIFEKDCWQQSPAVKSQLGYVAGDVRLYPWLTAERAFRIVGRIRGRDVSDEGHLLAERFRLEPDLPVRKMSRGNRQKLALVLALAHRPRLVVLDEPTSGLDPLMQDTLAECLMEMAHRGHTVFFSSHTLSEVDSLCDRVAIVKDGRIVADEHIAAMKAAAPRTVSLTFAEHAALPSTPPPGTREVRRGTNSLELEVVGVAADVVRWAAAQPIIDITVGRPNLDVLFRQYYDQPLLENASAVGNQKGIK